MIASVRFGFENLGLKRIIGLVMKTKRRYEWWKSRARYVEGDILGKQFSKYVIAD